LDDQLRLAVYTIISVGCCTLTTPFLWIYFYIAYQLIGVVLGQALKCSASKALNAESYNTLHEKEKIMKKTAFIIIGMQNDFVLPNAPQCIEGAVQIIPNIQKVLQTLDDIMNWLDIFANGVTEYLTPEPFDGFKEEWILDYKRLRVKAIKK